LVLSLLLANTQAISIRKESTRISMESKQIINDAVNDVLKITTGPVPGDVIH